MIKFSIYAEIIMACYTQVLILYIYLIFRCKTEQFVLSESQAFERHQTQTSKSSQNNIKGRQRYISNTWVELFILSIYFSGKSLYDISNDSKFWSLGNDEDQISAVWLGQGVGLADNLEAGFPPSTTKLFDSKIPYRKNRKLQLWYFSYLGIVHVN